MLNELEEYLFDVEDWSEEDEIDRLMAQEGCFAEEADGDYSPF